ncbi:VWA domain-containing protein [Actinomadura graeca]|uniref:VWA domain-containing protein n=1 Tax=Actinomadura graeca TaxID=2750812 RepID=A0ABX8QR40_9ACTN|nr:vWA domain-containing protein [Actinomadura graeca]QXJ21260.1 VWA domain-containing protein [Actinomadura graeca]
MSTPKIAPTGLGSPIYTVTDSRGLVADLLLDVTTGAPPLVGLRYPAGAAVTVTLESPALPAPHTLPSDPVGYSKPLGNRRVGADSALDGTDRVLTLTIQALSGNQREAWTVRATAAAPAARWQLSQGDNDPVQPTVTRIMCDPVAAFTLSAPSLTGGVVREGDPVQLTAASALGTPAEPTVVGAPVPAVAYRWGKTGGVAVTDFPQACSNGTTAVFTAPGVYRPHTMEITGRVWFETGCAGPVGFLSASSAAQLTVQARPRHLALVLDRSGSMSGARWDNAVTAARILGHLYAAMRTSVNPADRLGELVFEDTSCGWRPTVPGAPRPAPDPLIGPVLVLTDVPTAGGAVCGVDYGRPGACTPIGDGLVRAIDELGTLGTAGDPRFTIVLLTDGHENSGTVAVDPSTAAPGVLNFAIERQAGARQAVDSRLSLYTIGLGPTVQEDVLDRLAVPLGYRHVVQVSQVADAMAQMVCSSQAAQRVPAEPQIPGDPVRLVRVDPRVERLAVAVLWDGTGSIELSYRLQGQPAAPFQPVAVPVAACPAHAFAAVDMTALLGVPEEQVPATEWRILRRDAAGGPRPLPDGDLLFFVDLYVRADVVFDRDGYSTGDPMVLTARVRAGDDLVTGARVTVELVRPGESLGTFLSERGAHYRPPPTAPPDPPAPKALMIGELLRRADLPGLPQATPAGVFEDGTDELRDTGDGDYTNRYLDADQEGSFTWRFTISGTLPDGSVFSRVQTVSTWVGIRPDPRRSEIRTAVADGATAITVIPRDRKGEYLGPFRPGDVVFRSDSCPFDEEEPEPTPEGVHFPCRGGGTVLSRYDGGYTRVVRCPDKAGGTVTVTVCGVRIRSVRVGGRGVTA